MRETLGAPVAPGPPPRRPTAAHPLHRHDGQVLAVSAWARVAVTVALESTRRGGRPHLAVARPSVAALDEGPGQPGAADGGRLRARAAGRRTRRTRAAPRRPPRCGTTASSPCPAVDARPGPGSRSTSSGGAGFWTVTVTPARSPALPLVSVASAESTCVPALPSSCPSSPSTEVRDRAAQRLAVQEELHGGDRRRCRWRWRPPGLCPIRFDRSAGLVIATVGGVVSGGGGGPLDVTVMLTGWRSRRCRWSR